MITVAFGVPPITPKSYSQRRGHHAAASRTDWQQSTTWIGKQAGEPPVFLKSSDLGNGTTSTTGTRCLVSSGAVGAGAEQQNSLLPPG